MTTSPRTAGTSDHPLMTAAEVADVLGVGERFVRRLTSERRLPYLKIGVKVRFAREDVEAYMAASRRIAEVPVDPDPLAIHWAAMAEFRRQIDDDTHQHEASA
jgi:excisionase family DNA binding protein